MRTCENALKGWIHFFVMAPITICMFFGGTAFLKHFSLIEVQKNINENAYKFYSISVYLWPLVYFIMYTGIPPYMRNVTIDTVNFVWSIMLSYMNSNEYNIKNKTL